MGYNDLVLEWEERGWSDSEKAICPGCLDEPYLVGAVALAAEAELTCSFCGATPAASFDVFMEAFMVGVRNEFEQADDGGMPVDGGEYVFANQVLDQYEVADYYSWVAGGDNPDAVLEELTECLTEKQYVSLWWLALDPQSAYSSSWQAFCEAIKYQTRFVFWAEPKDEQVGAGEIRIREVMTKIGGLVEDWGLLKTYPVGTTFYRGRGHTAVADAESWGAGDLGTNARERSLSSTRMSPAGIPMFYGSIDLATTLDEMSHADGRPYLTVGQFETLQPLTVIDLTKPPAIPSIFDPETGGAHGEIAFLRSLIQDLRQPVDQARSNLDYIPTQVFSEYFLRLFEHEAIHGIAWRSVGDLGECVALDVPHASCVDDGDGVLRLIPEGKQAFSRTQSFEPLVKQKS